MSDSEMWERSCSCCGKSGDSLEDVERRAQLDSPVLGHCKNCGFEKAAEAEATTVTATAAEASIDSTVGVVQSGTCKFCGDGHDMCQVRCLETMQRDCDFGSFCFLLNDGVFQEKICDLDTCESSQRAPCLPGESHRLATQDYLTAQFDNLPVRKVIADCPNFNQEQRNGSLLWWSSCHHVHLCESDDKVTPTYFPKLSCKNILKKASQLQHLDVTNGRKAAPAWAEKDNQENQEDEKSKEEKMLDSETSIAAWSSTVETIDGTVPKDVSTAFNDEHSPEEPLKGLGTDSEGRARYTLRSNPKRSWRLRDQEFCVEAGSGGSVVVAESSFNVSFLALPSVAPTAATVVRKSSCKVVDEKPEKHTCTECGREFTSCKALFGHMRCHPEREWRGIQRPEGLPLQREETRLNPETHNAVLRKKPRSQGAATAEAAGLKCSKQDGERIAAGDEDGKLDSNCREEPLEDYDMIESLLMLARAGSGKQFDQSTSKVAVARMMEKHHEAHVLNKQRLETTKMKGKAAKDTRVSKGQASKEANSKATGEATTRAPTTMWNSRPEKDISCGETHWSQANVQFTSSSGRKLDLNVDGLAQGLDGGNRVVVKEQMEFTAGTTTTATQHKYECLTCNIIFKSYQSLGGHRASHKRVKGCFARNHPKGSGCMTSSDYVHDDGVANNDDGLKGGDGNEKASDLHMVSSRCELLKPKRCCTAEGEELERENMEKQQAAFAKKVDGCHECSVCHRVFSSGPALGGHKRCHWGGAGILEASSKGSGGEQQASVTPQGIAEAKAQPLAVHCPDLNIPVRSLSNESYVIN